MKIEEIKRKLDDDTLHASIVPYVRPLFERIKELEEELKKSNRNYSNLLSELPYDD